MSSTFPGTVLSSPRPSPGPVLYFWKQIPSLNQEGDFGRRGVWVHYRLLANLYGMSLGIFGTRPRRWRLFRISLTNFGCASTMLTLNEGFLKESYVHFYKLAI